MWRPGKLRFLIGVKNPLAIGRPRPPENTAPCGASPVARFATPVGLRPPFVAHPATLPHPDRRALLILFAAQHELGSHPLRQKVRTRLSAGGEWIRTFSTATQKPAISEAFRGSRAAPTWADVVKTFHRLRERGLPDPRIGRAGPSHRRRPGPLLKN